MTHAQPDRENAQGTPLLTLQVILVTEIIAVFSSIATTALHIQQARREH